MIIARTPAEAPTKGPTVFKMPDGNKLYTNTKAKPPDRMPNTYTLSEISCLNKFENERPKKYKTIILKNKWTKL